jgi:hypothetical protein
MKKINRMNWIWPGRRLFLVLGLAVMGLTLLSAQPALAGKPCEVPVDVTFRDDDADDIRSVAGADYTADIACGDGDLFFGYGPIEFRLDFLGDPVVSNGNAVVELGTAGGMLAMELGVPQPTTKVQFTLEKDRTRYFVAFRKDMWPDSDNLLVTRVSFTEWHVEAVPTDISGWNAQLLTLSKSKAYVPVAVEIVPFKMTLTCMTANCQ